MKDFTYLKNWITYSNPRPIILECEPSRSGMSLAVWDRDRKIFTIGGCGFDRIGCAIARVLEHCWQAELDACPEVPAKYGARVHDGRVNLEGACGYSCMQEIGALIGLKIGVYDSHHGTVIHITKG